MSMRGATNTCQNTSYGLSMVNYSTSSSSISTENVILTLTVKTQLSWLLFGTASSMTRILHHLRTSIFTDTRDKGLCIFFDVMGLQCLVARVQDGDQWSILDRSGALARAMYLDDSME